MRASAQKAVTVDACTDERSGVVLRVVLLVDEQAHVLRVMRLNLERCGYEVDAALNADHALQLMRTRHYDALIMTSDLPDMSARELCAHAEDLPSPLMLVCCDDDDEWLLESVAERLPTPVSLKWILARLGDVFAVPAEGGQCGVSSPDDR